MASTVIVLFMCAQTLGAALAGGLLTGVWGYARSISAHGGGCFVDASEISQGQVFLNEFFACFILLYPRQAVFFGPRLGPLLVGASLGLVSFGTSGIAPGYAGAQMNPARCLAYGIVRRDLADQWIWWFGPAAASLLMAALHNAVPPHHAQRDAEQQSPCNGATSRGQQSGV
ncbi:Aquaporin PIP2-7 [Tolypocladium paradoxum]|uniref:Aquaporin PIP2-7 n=1 Tax=Tolypocladium paradoxum TaxID=94208 RepID=A0A2S4KVG4_9HYPO|nr:Aquaporin PIP2-7 [Tolypocladium paradoxum]